MSCKISSMLLILFNLLWTPLYHSHTYPPNVQQIFYGDLSMESHFLPEVAENITEADVKKIENMDMLKILRETFTENYDEEYQDMNNITVNGEDAKDYNDVSAKLYNFTRKRSFSWSYDYVDSADMSPNQEIERKKQLMFEKLCLTFLYHSRYKMDKAFKQREPYREDKRYRIGYLFNRLRRLKTEMLKFVATAKLQYSTNHYIPHQNLTSLMRMYERVVRFDVDIRDTVELIKHVFSIEAPYDTYQSPSGKTKT